MSNDSDTNHLVRGSLLAKIGLSVRGIIVLLLCGTIAVLSFAKISIPQELFWMTSAAVTYYFGQQHSKPNP